MRDFAWIEKLPDAKFVFVKGSHRPRLLTRFECFEFAKWRGHGRRGHAPDLATCQPPFVSSKVTGGDR